MCQPSDRAPAYDAALDVLTVLAERGSRWATFIERVEMDEQAINEAPSEESREPEKEKAHGFNH